MTRQARDVLIGQFDTAWRLTALHLSDLSTPERLWRPAPGGPHVRQGSDGAWRADWPERESYDIGPPSIGWLTWHLVFWWSMVLDHTFGAATLTREDVAWPGDAATVRDEIDRLQTRWRAALDQLADKDLNSKALVRWPFRARALGDLVAWVNLELTKNAAEIGYARFLFAARTRPSG